ncbi:hypothetical protein CAI21_13955 [Alkalilimnicola ehrlichii]|nr:hypothetical protein CAI21_13955 [Alkalilimnicola ehrlichii]
MLRRLAHRRRQKGFYDAFTLMLFRRAWQRSRRASCLLDYLAYCRDLGRPLPLARRAELSDALPALHGRRFYLAQGLLAESGGDPPTQWGEVLREVCRCQQTWRSQFAAHVAQCRDQGICVVGNAPVMRGSRLGSFIDGQGLVMRFNRFYYDPSSAVDSGKKHDVWVRSPSLDRAPPAAVRWVVVSGPDVIFRLRNWGALADIVEQGVPVLTVPLEVWRALVKKLMAPPSAGLLSLAWLRQLLGSWQGVSAVGFSLGDSNCPVPRATRHHWAQEQALLRRWQADGLNLVSDAAKETEHG